MVVYKDVVDKEDEFFPLEELTPTDDPTLLIDRLEIKPMISLHILTDFSTP